MFDGYNNMKNVRSSQLEVKTLTVQFYYFLTGSSAASCSSASNSLTDKYCGVYLGWSTTGTANNPICGKFYFWTKLYNLLRGLDCLFGNVYIGYAFQYFMYICYSKLESDWLETFFLTRNLSSVSSVCIRAITNDFRTFMWLATCSRSKPTQEPFPLKDHLCAKLYYNQWSGLDFYRKHTYTHCPLFYRRFTFYFIIYNINHSIYLSICVSINLSANLFINISIC